MTLRCATRGSSAPSCLLAELVGSGSVPRAPRPVKRLGTGRVDAAESWLDEAADDVDAYGDFAEPVLAKSRP